MLWYFVSDGALACVHCRMAHHDYTSLCCACLKLVCCCKCRAVACRSGPVVPPMLPTLEATSQHQEHHPRPVLRDVVMCIGPHDVHIQTLVCTQRCYTCYSADYYLSHSFTPQVLAVYCMSMSPNMQHWRLHPVKSTLLLLFSSAVPGAHDVMHLIKMLARQGWLCSV